MERLNRQSYFLWRLTTIPFYLVANWAESGEALGAMFGFLCVAIAIETVLVIGRLHDLNYSGWISIPFLLVALFVPPLGMIAGLYLLFKKGTEGKNKYGEDPLTITQ